MDAIGLEFTVQILSLFPFVNIYEESQNGLISLRSSGSHKPRSPMKIRSNNGTAILYLDFSHPNIEQAKLHYDVTPASDIVWSKGMLLHLNLVRWVQRTASR